MTRIAPALTGCAHSRLGKPFKVKKAIQGVQKMPLPLVLVNKFLCPAHGESSMI